MNLSVLGFGLVSPVATNAEQHAAFIGAGVGLNPRSAFVVDGEPLAVRHCPWLGGRMEVRDRLIVLARHVLIEALAATTFTKPIPLVVCTSAPREGLSAEDLLELERALDANNAERWCAGRFRIAATVRGEAGAFEALERAEELLAQGEQAVAVVAVDSFISPAMIRELLPSLATPWTSDVPAPSEGAAAILVGAAEKPIARVVYAATRRGQGSDEDDAIVDGAAMTQLVRGAPPCAPIARWYGQSQVDVLRRHEWRYAIVRNPARAHPEFDGICLEHSTGALGAAAGAAHLVYGVACEVAALADELLHEGPFAAWAVSRDGTRGMAIVEVLK